MSSRFDARKNLIVVRAKIQGPKATAALPLALDTGATKTLIASEALVSIGYEPAQGAKSALITADSIVEVPIVTLKAIRCIGQVRRNFAVLCNDLPPAAAVAGLLGLDFLRDRVLTINFPTKEVKLTRPRRAQRKRGSKRGHKPAR